MTKQELALKNFTQKASTGKLVVDIGERERCGQFPYELREKLRYLKQLNKLFDMEYNKQESDLELMAKITFLITFYLNNYILEGEYTIYDIVIAPDLIKKANFIVLANGGGGGTGEVETFLELSDTPNSYAGGAGKLTIVNDSESALIFRNLNTIVNILINENDEEVSLTWSSYLFNHGLRPVMIVLYTRNAIPTKSTSPDYTEDGGITYKWYVGKNSPREWQIRIIGYIKDGSIIPPTNNLGFTYVFPAILQFEV